MALPITLITLALTAITLIGPADITAHTCTGPNAHACRKL
jgi:hypothetical protein